MSRIFLSHSSTNNAEAVVLFDWLEREGWKDEIFLDLDPTRGIAVRDMRSARTRGRLPRWRGQNQLKKVFRKPSAPPVRLPGKPERLIFTPVPESSRESRFTGGNVGIMAQGPPAPKVRRIIVHVVVFFVSTAASVIIIEGLAHLLGPRFSHGLDEVITEVTYALDKLQPWKLASQYWALVLRDVSGPLVCEPVWYPSPEPLSRGIYVDSCHPQSNISHIFIPIIYVISFFNLFFTLFFEPVARSIVDLVQLIAGGAIAIVVCRKLKLKLKEKTRLQPAAPRPGEGKLERALFNWVWLLFFFSILTIACTTLLSIPILFAIRFVAYGLRGIVGTPEASMGAIAGSASTMISIFSARSFEAGTHELMSALFKRVVGRWLH